MVERKGFTPSQARAATNLIGGAALAIFIAYGGYSWWHYGKTHPSHDGTSTSQTTTWTGKDGHPHRQQGDTATAQLPSRRVRPAV